MKSSKFQQQLVGTVVYMKIPLMSTKWCSQPTSNETYFSNSWFSGVKTSEEAMDEGVDYFGPLNMIEYSIVYGKIVLYDYTRLS